MRSPSFYPHGPDAVEVVESHISWVFLAGDLAFKLRKPVVFPFLDYGTADRRRELSEEEVRLGRRLAPRLYMGVRPLVYRSGEWAMGSPGDVGDDHVVVMRRFDDRRTLAALLERDEATPALVRDVARKVARFHAGADRSSPGSFDSQAVAATVGETFETLIPYAHAFRPRALRAGHRFAVSFLHARREQFEARSSDGFVRECHGDLRAEHVISQDGAVEIFDPLEFDRRLRDIDVSADLAFLVMDLIRAQRDDLAAIAIGQYESAGGDHGGRPLLFYYAAYRAWVRAKVACLRAGELEPGERAGALAEANALADLARRLAWRARCPLVLAVCGASATGKTQLAETLAPVAALPHISSDVVRKELAGLSPSERAPEREYSEEASLRTYAELGARAAAAGDGAIIDATFRRRSDRAAFPARVAGPWSSFNAWPRPRSSELGHCAERSIPSGSRTPPPRSPRTN